MRTLRGRLIVGLLLGITVTLLLSGAAVSAVVERRLRDELDRSLTALLRTSMDDVARDLGRRQSAEEAGGFLGRAARLQFERRRLAFLAPADGADVLLQAWVVDGGRAPETWVRSEALGEQSLPRLAAGSRVWGLPEALGVEPVLETARLPDGTRVRVAGLAFRAPLEGGVLRDMLAARRRPGGAPRGRRPEAPSPGVGPDGLPGTPVIELAVALDTASLSATVRQLRVLLLLGWLISSAACAGVAWWSVRRGLRPLDALREQMGDRRGDAVGSAFTLPDAPGELSPVVEQLNALMERVGRALQREQALQSAAAHELRTPLAGLRSTLEVALSRPRSEESWVQTAEQSLAMTLELQGLVESLLELARAAGPGSVRPAEAVRPAEMLQAAWAARREAAGARGLDWRCEVPADLELRTDAGLLRRLLENLVDNAVSHADPDTALEATCERRGAGVRLSVSNARADATPALAERAAEPFWRGDPGRGGTVRHAGLGLALCQRIAEALGGALTLRSQAGRFEASVELPAAGGTARRPSGGPASMPDPGGA